MNPDLVLKMLAYALTFLKPREHRWPPSSRAAAARDSRFTEMKVLGPFAQFRRGCRQLLVNADVYENILKVAMPVALAKGRFVMYVWGLDLDVDFDGQVRERVGGRALDVVTGGRLVR